LVSAVPLETLLLGDFLTDLACVGVVIPPCRQRLLVLFHRTKCVDHSHAAYLRELRVAKLPLGYWLIPEE
jgi:hypothetical protein